MINGILVAKYWTQFSWFYEFLAKAAAAVTSFWLPFPSPAVGFTGSQEEK